MNLHIRHHYDIMIYNAAMRLFTRDRNMWYLTKASMKEYDAEQERRRRQREIATSSENPLNRHDMGGSY